MVLIRDMEMTVFLGLHCLMSYQLEAGGHLNLDMNESKKFSSFAEVAIFHTGYFLFFAVLDTSYMLFKCSAQSYIASPELPHFSVSSYLCLVTTIKKTQIPSQQETLMDKVGLISRGR